MPSSDVNYIEAMGHTYGEHIIPVQADHIYLYPASNDANVTVYSPGDVTLVQVVAQTHTGGADVGLGTDYTYYFSPCKSLMFGFIHVRTVSDRINQTMATVTPRCDNSSGLASNCTYQDLGLKLSSGEVIGKAIGSGSGLDFGGADVRTPALNWIDQSALMYLGGIVGDSQLHAICPLDYFTSPLKTQLYGLINITKAGTNGIPACGSLMQDEPGTGQGNWFKEGWNDNQAPDFAAMLALAHYNLDPSQAVISAGTDLLPSNDLGNQIIYQPISSGYVNPDPSRIQPDGHVYCIEGSLAVGNTAAHVDLQLTNSTTLRAEYATGSCSAAPTLTANALTYDR